MLQGEVKTRLETLVVVQVQHSQAWWERPVLSQLQQETLQQETKKQQQCAWEMLQCYWCWRWQPLSFP
jgi:hypothetical protein